jgi:hypothetical protein
MGMSEPEMRQGGCHCGKVRYEVKIDLEKIMACNCSICAKHGLWLTFAPASEFKLLDGDDVLKDYQFARKQVHHLFCSECGIESFGRGAMPDGTEMIAVNVRCLDGVDISSLTPKPFDGKSL